MLISSIIKSMALGGIDTNKPPTYLRSIIRSKRGQEWTSSPLGLKTHSFYRFGVRWKPPDCWNQSDTNSNPGFFASPSRNPFQDFFGRGKARITWFAGPPFKRMLGSQIKSSYEACSIHADRVVSLHNHVTSCSYQWGFRSYSREFWCGVKWDPSRIYICLVRISYMYNVYTSVKQDFADWRKRLSFRWNKIFSYPFHRWNLCFMEVPCSWLALIQRMKQGC